MKDMVHVFALIDRNMLNLAALAKIDGSKKYKQYKSLHDAYTKARARQYKQMRNITRTRHK
jgi:hypothetical protein